MLEDALAQIARIDNISEMLELILESLLERFADELGFEGGRIYRREGEDFYLCCGFGTSREAPVGLHVPRNYPPHLRTLEEGLLIMRRDEPGIDQDFEHTIGVDSTFAAIAVGEGSTHVIAFSIKGDVREEQLLYSLTAVRHVINLKLAQLKVSEVIEESRAVHEIILPDAAPAFAGYDLAGRAQAAEVVGGDLFDYLPLAGGRLGIAIGDSTGHGLPSALLARDVLTGLRMGVGDTLAIDQTIARLNRLIHRAARSTRFVSLFYGELAADGSLVYCNAGHNPPLLLSQESFTELDRGGTVLGAIPTSSYESARLRLVPGDLLVLYTDGVIERLDQRGELYGVERLKELLLTLDRGLPAQGVVATIFAAVDSYGRGSPLADDVTALAVRKL